MKTRKRKIHDNTEKLKVVFSWKDIAIARPHLSDKKCKKLFDNIFSNLENALISEGNEAIEILLQQTEEESN